jgi:hypothetical protein
MQQSKLLVFEQRFSLGINVFYETDRQLLHGSMKAKKLTELNEATEK